MPEDRADQKGLETLIRKGEVDTVLTVFADGMGRLLGKRVVGRYFLDHVLHDGVHACIYLFTVDMEMEPLPGFRLASWERGYGDMKLVPDLTTWRLLPWLPKTALVFCDVYTEEGEPIEEAPRWVLRRQLERAGKIGYRVKTASELELYLFKESFDEARAKRFHDLTPVSSYLEDYHILQTSKEEPLVRAIRKGDGFFNLPDMDFGARDAAFVPFFGVPAVTLLAPSRLAKALDMIVQPIVAEILPGGRGYRVRFEEPWSDFPSDDPVADAARMNRWIESEIRRNPAQYLWVHRRFKTRPPGEPSLY